MSITLTLTADDGSDMRRHLLNLLGLYAADQTSPYFPRHPERNDVPKEFDPEHPDRGDFGKLGGDANLGEILGRPWVEGDTLAAPAETMPGEQFEQFLANVEAANTLMPATEPQGSPPEAVRKKRAHRRVKPVEAPVAAPMPLQDERDPIEEALDALTAEVDDEGEQQEPDLVNAVSNEMLKREVIASLADMFTAGNVKVVRHVLHKYGHGAKSFPEIDPAHFPEIKAALDRNEAA
jgi:hypothetical protein